MKIHYIVAASLFVGTSALAWGPSAEPASGKDKEKVEAAYKVDTKAGQGEAKAPQAALVAKSNDLPAIETPLVRPAAMSGFDAKAMVTPATLAKADAPPADESAMNLAAAEKSSIADGSDTTDGTDQGMKVADSKPVEEPAGTGGPLELTENSANLAPRPAAANYPACQPGPGDDNCIQLYEPGVEVALASWNQPTGGLMDETRTAMGGPFEPVDGKAVESGADAEQLAAADLPGKATGKETAETPDTAPVDAEPARKA